MVDTLLEAQVGKLLTARGLKIAVAESCTGGLILHRLTNINGSSAYVMGGIVAYSYEAKVQFLNVSWDTLHAHGAVSEEVALEMVRGVRAAFGVDVALSVTGIAGPGGGMPNKPVGLTYLALAAQPASGTPTERVIRRVWDSDREGNKALSAEAALTLLHEYLLEQGS